VPANDPDDFDYAEAATRVHQPLAFFRFRLAVADEGQGSDETSEGTGREEAEEELYIYAESAQSKLASELAEEVRRFFGPSVFAFTTVRRGSVEIATIVVGLGLLQQYRGAIENLDWLRAHLENIVRRFFFGYSTQVTSSASPAGALRDRGALDRLNPVAIDWLPLYFVLQNAILLGVLIWLLIDQV
jgi:hypothetical protein